MTRWDRDPQDIMRDLITAMYHPNIDMTPIEYIHWKHETKYQ